MTCPFCSRTIPSGACIKLELIQAIKDPVPSTHRLYNEMWKLNRVWRMGNASDGGGSRYSIDLGETAVDFDFGAPRFVQDAAVVHLDESQVSTE